MVYRVDKLIECGINPINGYEYDSSWIVLMLRDKVYCKSNDRKDPASHGTVKPVRSMIFYGLPAGLLTHRREHEGISRQKIAFNKSSTFQEVHQ